MSDEQPIHAGDVVQHVNRYRRSEVSGVVAEVDWETGTARIHGLSTWWNIHNLERA